MVIRLSELAGKNIVNVFDGVRLGVIQDADITFESQSGRLEGLIIPSRGSLRGLWGERGRLQIPWRAIHKIGREVVIVNMGQNGQERAKGGFF